MLYDNVILCA